MNETAEFNPTSVGVAIVNYNAGQHLLDCIESAKAEGIVDIVVADNGSRDNSLQMLREQHPEIPVLNLPNPGYGCAVNRCVQKLTNEFIFVLNPDAVVRPGATKKLYDTLAREPHAGAVGPRIEDSEGHLYPSARRFPSYFDAIGHAIVGPFKADNKWSRKYKAYDLEYDKERSADWVSGAAMFVRRNAFNSVGGFDSSYWMYMEDVDLCLRLHRAGWNIWFNPDAVVFHVGGVSTSQVPYKLLAAHHRSLARFASRYATPMQRPFLPFIYLGLVLRLGLLWAKTFQRKGIAKQLSARGKQLIKR